MLFGDPSIFAVEVALDKDSRFVGSSFAGRIQIHTAGVPIGNFHEPMCVFGPVAQHLTTISATSAALWHPSLAGLTAEEIFRKLDAALFIGQAESYPPEYDLMGFLTNVSEAFDTVKAFVVRTGEDLLLLVARQDSAPTLVSSKVPLAVFAGVSASFGAWLSAHESEARGEA